MNTIILGNIIALFGSIVMVMIGFLKKKEQIIIAQCIQCGFIGLANLVLGGISGFVTNCFTILRNGIECYVMPVENKNHIYSNTVSFSDSFKTGSMDSFITCFIHIYIHMVYGL